MIELLNAVVLLSNFVIVPALSYGSQLALGALGVTLIFGILRFANFAHGDLMAFGTMIMAATSPPSRPRTGSRRAWPSYRKPTTCSPA